MVPVQYAIVPWKHEYAYRCASLSRSQQALTHNLAKTTSNGCLKTNAHIHAEFMIATHLYHASLADCSTSEPPVSSEDGPTPSRKPSRRRQLWTTSSKAAAPPPPLAERSRSPLRDYFSKKCKTCPVRVPSEASAQNHTPPRLQYNLDEQATARIQAQHQSPLLSLPGEIRTAIYQYVLQLPLHEAPLRHFRDGERVTKPHSVLALLETCRLVHLEAEHIFFETNRLTVDKWSKFRTFTFSVNATRLCMLRKLTLVEYGRYGLRTALTDLKNRVPNVESIHVIWAGQRPNWTDGSESITSNQEEVQRELVELRNLKELVFMPFAPSDDEDHEEYYGQEEEQREAEQSMEEWVRLLAANREVGTEEQAREAAEYGRAL